MVVFRSRRKNTILMVLFLIQSPRRVGLDLKQFEDVIAHNGSLSVKEEKYYPDGFVFDSVTEEGRFRCEICQISFAFRKGMRRHQKKSHPELFKEESSTGDDKLYNCDVCDAGFDVWKNLTRHKRTMHGGTIYYCGKCNFQSNRSHNLRIHEEYVHEAELDDDEADPN